LRGHPFDRACTKGWRHSYAAAGNYWRCRQLDLSQRAGKPPDLTAASQIGDRGAAEGSIPRAAQLSEFSASTTALLRVVVLDTSDLIHSFDWRKQTQKKNLPI